MALIGRAAERALLDGVLEDVRRGQSRALLLSGDPGIGKTALLKYLADSAPDLSLARAVGVESEIELAFASLHQLCAPMLDRLAHLPGPQREALETVFALRTGPTPDRFLVALAVLSLVSAVADERPVLCLVDDAQWLDHASSQTLAFVARRLLAEPIGIVLAAREPTQDLEQLPVLQLTGLASDDARALLSRAVPSALDEQVRERIIAETRGNPLALLELPRGLTAEQLEGDFAVADRLDLSGKIQESFARRLGELTTDARRLVLLAAAEPLGDPELLRRAAERLGIGWEVTREAQSDGVLAIGAGVRFSHPLARSAAYGSATPEERRAAHLALADATDGEVDPDRRASHLASAAAGPDERVAMELERSAGRARARGGMAAAAAFLRRAVALTEDPARRVDRSLDAAQASLQAGAFDTAFGLLAAAEAGPIDELQRARLDLLRAQVSFAYKRDGTAAPLLLAAAQRMQPLDARMARAGYLAALAAVLFASRFASPAGTLREVAEAVRDVSAGPRPDLLLQGWATLLADGAAAATPILQAALGQFDATAATAEDLPALWLVTNSAASIWDEARWDAASSAQVELARSSGALGELALALRTRIYVHLLRGELETAETLAEEAAAVSEATGGEATTLGGLALTVLRAGPQEATAKLDAAAAEASRRRFGGGLTSIAWTRALLWNTHGNAERALAAAREASGCPTNNAMAGWGLVEQAEAASRAGDPQAATEAADRLAEIAEVAGTEWALGVAARSRALVSRGQAADELYREALDRLGRTDVRLELARAHLLYGEWLRHEHRRLDSRTQLRAAYDQFSVMGAAGFADRAGKELLAAGERVQARSVETRDELTSQERQIARLARDGLSNPEIGARLFLSPRTVEWHLRKVFAKLEIRSRRELADALPNPDAGSAGR